MRKSQIVNSTCINGKYGEETIAEHWKDHYENILNSWNDLHSKELVL
jgi:hypothetical protein